MTEPKPVHKQTPNEFWDHIADIHGDEYKPDPDATELYDSEQFKMSRWAPWEWIVYEFETGLAAVPIKVWPKPKM